MTVQKQQDIRREFLQLFRQLCNTRSSWQVWADLMTVFACSLSNPMDPNKERRNTREAEFSECIARLGGIEIPAQMLLLVTAALERNPEQDFLGGMFMELNLGNHWKGQFFTPYSICKLMAEINCTQAIDTIEEKGWISINDCACGAGATLIAAANVLRSHGRNFQTEALFVAQDVDRIAGLMCYIQLSLLGCAGYVVIADSLLNPVTGDAISPVEKDGQEFWYTLMYYRAEWDLRKMIQRFDQLTAS